MRKAAFSLIALLALSWPFVAPWVQAQTFTVLYSFTGGADGSSPQAGLVRDKRGNLYGTTAQGGSSANCFLGCGVVFKLDTWGNETVLHTFTNTPDGALPLAALVRDKRRATSTAPPRPAVLPFTEPFSSWIRPAMRACDIASQARPTGRSPKQVCSGTRQTTSTAPPSPAALPIPDREIQQPLSSRLARAPRLSHTPCPPTP